jgi:hypothetical protein
VAVEDTDRLQIAHLTLGIQVVAVAAVQQDLGVVQVVLVA